MNLSVIAPHLPLFLLRVVFPVKDGPQRLCVERVGWFRKASLNWSRVWIPVR